MKLWLIINAVVYDCDDDDNDEMMIKFNLNNWRYVCVLILYSKLCYHEIGRFVIDDTLRAQASSIK